MAVFALMGVLFWLRKTTVCRDYDKAVWFVVGVWGFAASPVGALLYGIA